MRKVLLGAALAAAVLVPAATAGRTASVELALVPLPKSALGTAARHLPLAQDSGVASNADEASQAGGNVTAKQLKRLGRVTGYVLDYGSPFADTAGIREIQTEVERYGTTAEARKGLTFWRRQELTKPPKGLGMQFSVKRLQLSGVPKPSWVYAGSAAIKGLKPILGVDAEIQKGPYLLDISVAAGSKHAAARLVPVVARPLYQRLQRALAGRLHANPTELPPTLKAGPPPHGPKPAALALRPADLGKGSKVLHKAYVKPKGSLDKTALSVYDLTIASPASFPVLSQEVVVGSSKLEAQYFAAIVLSAGVGYGHGIKATPVSLGGVGDDARGELAHIAINGQTVDEEAVVLLRGTYLDFLIEASPSAFTAADVRKLAQLGATRLNAGFH